MARDEGVTARRATEQDRAAIASLLADAFADDPVVTWLVRSDAGRDRARGLMFDSLLGHFGLPGGETWMAADDAAALWLPPSRVELRLAWWENLLLLPRILRVTGLLGVSRMDAYRRVTGMHHPKQRAHWYLMMIGVAPERRGRGIGSALLEWTLADTDARGMPSYLEATSPKNVPLYLRHGFEVTSEFRVSPGAPPLWGMWREPSPRDGAGAPGSSRHGKGVS